MDDAELLNLAADIAWEASGVILALRARGVATERRADQGVVTEADRAAEAVIAARLRAATPAIEVVAEEEVSRGHVPASAESYWLVDPLDGTRDFVALRDGFCVNIGLVRHGRPVLGVVSIPACAEIYGGLVGSGAWRESGMGRHAITVRPAPAGGLMVLSARHAEDDAAVRAALPGQSVASVVQMGSAAKFCRVAEGTADAYVRLGRTMEWDTAGPEAVLLAAGGRLATLDGKVLGYGKPGWANPGFVCRGAA